MVYARLAAVIACGLMLMSLPSQSKQILVTQSWDDGDINDVRLTELLRKHGAKATFFIFPSKYVELKETPAAANARDPRLIPFDQFLQIYKGFEVAAHGFHHPDMRKLSPEELKFELDHSKRVLEDWFGTPVRGLAYPCGAYDGRVQAAVKEAGYVYARAVDYSGPVFPAKDPYALKVSVHVNDPKFWEKFEEVKKEGGVFYFWGHSYEIRTEPEWKEFEAKIAKLSSDPDAKWVTNLELFEKK